MSNSTCGRATTKLRLPWRVAALTSAALLAVVPQLPAYADTADQRDLQSQYTSLTASLITAHAAASGKTLSTYLADTKLSVLSPKEDLAASLDGGVPEFSPLLAPSSTSLEAGVPMTATSLQASSLDELNATLAANNVGFSKKDTASLSALTRAVLGKSATPDARVTLGGAKWVADFAATTLAAPSSPQMPSAPTVPAGALPFGLLINQSLARMVATSPALFNNVSSTGVGSKKMQSAFNEAMRATWASSYQDLQSSVGDPCTGSMMAVMATGDASKGAGCGTACTAGGMYLHGQTASLFNPQLNSKVPTSIPGVLSNFQANSMPAAVKAQMVQNQAVSGSQLDQLLSSASSGCEVASSVATGKLSNTFPKVWNGLK